MPVLEDYAWRLWDYWERHLDPDLSLDRSLAGAVRGKVVVITGGSSGIGLAAAERCADAGATVVIVARDPDKLEAARAKLAERGTVFAYACDISDYTACDGFARQLLAEHGGVDFLVNNAGRSIRRSIDLSHERFHDFERTMQLNYFAVVRLTMALMPSLLERGGHVVNISSIGVLSNAPRFSAYVASKAAMEAWTRCAGGRVRRPRRDFHHRQHAARAHADDRSHEDLRADASRDTRRCGGHGCGGDHRPAEAHRDRLGIAAEVLHLVAPRITEVVMNTAYRMFPDSAAAKGEQGEKKPDPAPTKEAVMFASLLRGVHW